MKVKINCENKNCKKEFLKKKSSKQRFCSHFCASQGEYNSFYKRTHTKETRKLLGRDMSGDKNPMFGKGYLLLGENNGFYKKKHTEQSLSKMSLSQKGKKRKPLLIETKEKMSKSRLLYLNKLVNNNRFKDTKPELIFESYLKELNIKYRKQELFGFYSFDFYLIDLDIYVEVDGDYWHSNPKIYNYDILSKRQILIVNKDKKKNNFMKIKNKILLRFWENEILNNKEFIINKFKKLVA